MSRRIPTRKRAAQIGALVTASALVLSACGSSSDDNERGPSASMESSGAALSGDPIKIGYGASMSGPQAANGLSAQAVAHAWEEYTNRHGGILGHPVEVDMVDTKNTVPGATAVAKSFLSDDSIDAIFLTDLVAEGAMVDTFKNTPVAVISGGGSSDILWSGLPNVFQDVSGSDYTIKAYADQAETQGAKSFGWAACAEVAVCTENGDKAASYAESLGMQFAGNEQFSATAPDYTAECLAFIGKGADSIAFNIGFAVGTRVATDCIQQGYTGKFSVINSGFDQDAFSKVSGFQAVGGTNGFPWWSDAAPVQTYRDAMATFSPDGTVTSGNSTAIWSSFELLKKALTDAHPATIDRASVLDAMNHVKNETLGGLLPQPVTYTAGKPSERVGCHWMFTYNAGDDNPVSIEPDESGNGATGDLASTCLGY